MTKKRRVKIVTYTIIIIVLAIGLPLVVNKMLKNNQRSTGNNPNSISDQVAAKVASIGNKSNQDSTIANTTDINQQPSSDTTANQPPDNTTSQPESVPPSTGEAALQGQAVTSSVGYKITIPNNWYYSFVNEGSYESLNFGTQNFGPDNPYSVTMTGDVYGYVVPATAIPTDAVGALDSEQTLTTNEGKSVSVKNYKGDITGAGSVTQVIATFTVNSNQYGLVFYGASDNTTQLDQLTAAIKTLIQP